MSGLCQYEVVSPEQIVLHCQCMSFSIIVSLKSVQYSLLLFLLILVELGVAAFIFFDKSWKEVGIRITNVFCFRRHR